MDIENELQTRYKRFCEEANAIKSQVDFIEESVILTAVKEKSNEFTRNLIPSFKSIEEVHHQLDELIESFSENKARLNRKLCENEYEEIPENFLGIDIRSDEGELLQFIYNIIESGETDYQKIANEVRNELKTMCIDNGENGYEEIFLKLYNSNEKLHKYIDVCFKMCHNDQIANIEESIDLIEHHTKLLSLIDVRNSINIYRQAFIQLIATFDTIVFECFRLRFNANFFEWLNFFKDSSVKYSEIANCKGFETFQRETVEEKLKNCYLKDLLNIARNQYKDIFVGDANDLYLIFR